MSEESIHRSPGLSGARRKAVDLTQLVRTQTIADGPLPLLIEPAVDGVELAEWTASNRDQVDAYFDKHGAILFRGFAIDGATGFERIAGSIASNLFSEYGDLPQEGTSERIYHSTPYPADKTILFHNESSHLPSWPLRQFFFCVIPSQDRGTTPLLDCRLVAERLDPELLEEFERKGLMYVRNFSPGLDVPWQEFFKTEDRAEVERMCADEGMACEWKGDSLRIKQVSPAVVNHPRTGERLFFNQIQLHHVACLDPETRESLGALFSEEDMPRNVYFGDGSVIPDEVVEQISALYEELCVEFPWQAGDLIAVDNMIVAHARRPYSGERKILVAMGEMVRATDLEPETVSA